MLRGTDRVTFGCRLICDRNRLNRSVGMESKRRQLKLLCRAQESHVMHLVQPVWTENWPKLWSAPDATAVAVGGSATAAGGSANAGSDAFGGAAVRTSNGSASSGTGSGSQAMRWVGVLVARGAGHNNVSVRKMTLASFYGLPWGAVAAGGAYWRAALQVSLATDRLPALNIL